MFDSARVENCGPSLSSGALLQVYGWDAVSYGAVPFLVVAVAAVGTLLMVRRAAAAPAG